jgi:anti-sigma-K factor RskA
MDLHDLTAAYALDALDAHETREYEAHLAQCERCRDELSALSESATALAWAVDSPVPPVALRDRILDAAAAERVNVVPLPVRSPWLVRGTSAVAAVAACAAVGLGVWATTLSHSVNRERTARAAEARAVEILSDPTSRRITLGDRSVGRDGLLAVDTTGQAVLVVDQLPPAPSGKTYEAWVIPRGGEPRPAGLFRGGDRTTVVQLERSVPRGALIAATIERAGGADAPTDAPVLQAQA